MHDEFHNQRHGTFFFIAIFDGIFFALTVYFGPNLFNILFNFIMQ
jgi:hypothetical protein